MMNTCKQIRLELATGEGQDRPGLRSHLERCAECAALARDLDGLRHQARALPRPACPPLTPVARRAHSPGRWLALAAAGCLALALAGGALWLRGTAPPAAPAPGPPRVLASKPREPDLLGAISAARAVWSDPGSERWGRWTELPARRSASPLARVAWLNLKQDSDDFDGWLDSLGQTPNPKITPER